jgi:carboxypeptidase Taq
LKLLPPIHTEQAPPFFPFIRITAMSAYTQLHDHFSRISRFNHLQAMAGWDEAAMMPPGGGESRSRAMAELNVLVHQLQTDPRLAELLEKASDEPGLGEWEKANLLLMDRTVRRLSAIPDDMVEAGSRARMRCVQAWRVSRARNDWQEMLPLMQDNLEFARKEAILVGERSNLPAYDALVDRYEPGMTSARITELFRGLKGFLPDIIAEIQELQGGQDLPGLGDDFPVEKQRILGHEMMRTLGFDFNHGRLDVSHHPFCGGVPEDVRITTRYTQTGFLESLMAVLHETGHAMYEQGLPKAWQDQPVGNALGMAMHESQSLLMEMQACRTREFTSYLTPIARRIFNQESNPAWSVEALLACNTRVTRGLIRVDADEVTYPMHVILRFELEQALINGEMEMVHIPEAWDTKMKEYLGVATGNNFRDGCLQDVHWMEGLFGYFPTYSLGAMIAAQLFAAANADQPEILSSISEGNFKPLLAWLRANVHSKGSLVDSDTLLIQATGTRLDPEFFRRHLLNRYRDQAG